jgi:hypothetical protein
MKSFLTLLLLLFSGFCTVLAPPPPQPSLLNCDNIDPLLHTLANLYPKQKCPPCDDPDTETRRECFDHKDNDGDGKTDCEDPDCLKDRRIQQRCRMMTRRKPQVKNKQ